MDRIPILNIGSTLLVSIQVEIQDQLALQLQEDLTERVAEINATGVIVDVSGVEMVDSFIGRMLSQIAMMSSVLGAETIVVGIQPAVAITLVELGLPLKGFRTALSMDRALEMLGRPHGAPLEADHESH